MFSRIRRWLASLSSGLETRRISPFLVLVVLNIAFLAGLAVVVVSLINVNNRIPTTPQQIIVTATGGAPALPTPVIEVAGIEVTAVTPTPGPSPTAPANPFDVGGTIAAALRRNGHTNLWAITPGRAKPTRLTAGPWDDRDPAWSPDGTKLAFASRRSGSWDLYVLDITSGLVARLTNSLGFEAHPSWSPDGAYIAYEGYEADNFDVFIVRSVGAATPIRVTRDPAADFAPAWSPNGRSIAFVSYRGGGPHPDLYQYNLDEPDERRAVTRLTNTPDVAEDEPAWSKDGRLLLYADAVSPLHLVYAKSSAGPEAAPVEVAQGFWPTWTPDGTGILTAFNQNDKEFIAAAALGAWSAAPVAIPVEGRVGALSWTLAPLPAEPHGTIAQAANVVDAPLYSEHVSVPAGSQQAPYTLLNIADLRAPFPAFSDRVDESFQGLRFRVIADAGWDFLQVLDNASLNLNDPLPPGLPFESWNKAGRAFDISQAAINDGWGVLIREQEGNRVYWRLWVRARQGDGSFGEPLRHTPWNFQTRFSGDPVAYDAGGTYFPAIPAGYFIDFTALAADYGWNRVASGDNWKVFFPTVQYWHFQNRGGLTWLDAMKELYAAADIATPTPFQSPTFTPSPTVPVTATFTPSATFTATDTPTITRTPTDTRTPTIVPTRLGQPSPRPTITRTFTPTASATRTPRPSPTLTPSRTPSPAP